MGTRGNSRRRLRTIMTLDETLVSVWRQSLDEKKPAVSLEKDSNPVRMFRSKKLRSVEFNFGPFQLVGIEQNPATGSRWAELARAGNRIMQFRCQGRYVANVCEGKVFRYPAWKGLKLPE